MERAFSPLVFLVKAQMVFLAQGTFCQLGLDFLACCLLERSDLPTINALVMCRLDHCNALCGSALAIELKFLKPFCKGRTTKCIVVTKPARYQSTNCEQF